jgi:hypothetical protein
MLPIPPGALAVIRRALSLGGVDWIISTGANPSRCHDAKDIPEHAGSGDHSAGAGAGHDEGTLPITFGHEHEKIVGSIE